ncbi:MAG: glycosyl transferase family 2 [Xanthobacteraceae bacterium]|nr:glycosyl transferase family 2 [Xanthobacteraceae bacterium]
MRTVAALVALVASVHLGAWALFEGRASAPSFDGQLASVSYAPYAGSQRPGRDRASPEQIRSDLKLLAPLTRAVRTYESTNGAELVPAIAAEFGLKVTVGVWLDPEDDKDPEIAKAAKAKNEREIKSAILLARNYSNVNAIVVGNETVFRNDLSVMSDAARVDWLIEYIRQVKQRVHVPVTTGEVLDKWEKHPKLVSAVDFIGAHILPYWDNRTAGETVAYTFNKYADLQHAYPGKRIVIAEFGWPSAGTNRHVAVPGRFEQATVLRQFVSGADQLGIDYNVIEAFDQKWKVAEGGVGAYWGLFDADRHAKFSWNGFIVNPDHWKLAGIAILLGILLSLPILNISAVTARQAGLLALAANGVGAWLACVVAYWQGHYFVFGAAFALGLGTLLLIPLLLIALARMDEIAAVSFGRGPKRLIASPSLVPAIPSAEPVFPKVSIHVPAYREPPEMLCQTLDALAQLDYPNFECVVIINNTPDPALWQPVEQHCKLLGERFKFVNVENLQGYKAGALRLALIHTAADAEIIGVIDADYVVTHDWLKDLVPAFADPKVGLVQAPQDHRDSTRSLLHHAMNAEYAGFFDIGMVQRNEANAIIVHGTMCLIRRSAMEVAGGWSSDTICEDTDLGLSILEHGYVALYTNRRYGYGLLPDTFEAYKKQRHRWAYGGVQIVRKHWRRMLPGASALSGEQRREFSMGWLNWLGAESIGVVVAILNLLWVPVVLVLQVAVPDKILTLPIVAAFVVSLMHFAVLYRLRVNIPRGQTFGCVFAAMSVQMTVAKAVATGLFVEHLPFLVTAKGGKGRKMASEFPTFWESARQFPAAFWDGLRKFPAFWEALLGLSLIAGALVLYLRNFDQVHAQNLFALVLVVQSLPFLSAAGLAMLESSRINDFAFWRGLEAKLAFGLARRRALGQAPAAAQIVENRIETVQ